MISYFIKNTEFQILYLKDLKGFIYKGSSKSKKKKIEKVFNKKEEGVNFIEKKTEDLLAKGYVKSEINPIAFDAFYENLKANRTYYFVKVNEKSLQDSLVASFSIAKGEKKYTLTTIPFDKITNEKNKKVDYLKIQHYKFTSRYGVFVKPENLKSEIEMLFHFFLLSGFVNMTENIFIPYITNKPFDSTTEYPDEMNGYFEDFIKFNFFKENLYFTNHYYIVDKATNTYYKHSTNIFPCSSLEQYENELERNLTFFKEKNFKNETYSEKEFLSLYTEEKPNNNLDLLVQEAFNCNTLEQIKFKDAVEIYGIKDLDKQSTYFEQLQPYIWADKTGDNKLEWDCCLVFKVSKNYFLSGIFKLKDFNILFGENFSMDSIYSSDWEKTFKKFRRKKAHFEPLAFTEVGAILTGKASKTLYNQKIKQTLTYQYIDPDDGFFGYETIVQVFANYAIIWSGDFMYYNFFQNQEQWQTALEAQFKKESVQKSSEVTNKASDKILGIIALVKKENKNIVDKGKLIEKHPEFYSALSEEDQRGFKEFPLTVKPKDWQIEEDYQLTSETSIFVTGDLTVNGTLFLKKHFEKKYDVNSYLIVLGNLTAENIIFDSDFKRILVLGNIQVNNISVCCLQKKYKKISCSNTIHTAILLHNKKTDIDSPFTYNKEVSKYSAALIDKEELTITKEGLHFFDYEKIFSRIISRAPLLEETKISEKPDPTAFLIEAFINKMKNWGEYYGDLAGCENVGIFEDDEIREGYIHPNSGDWVIVDNRCNSGTYGYDHESSEIRPVKIKNAKKHGVNYRAKEIVKQVDTPTLLYRYQWISNLFIDWSHITTVTPFGVFKDVEEIVLKFDNEKSDLKNDPHLALYWLLHFGFSLDKRYEEVKKLIVKNGLESQLSFITKAIAFFDHTDAFYAIEIGKKEKFKDLFLIRRAYLVYFTQSQSYNGGIDNLDLWWTSVKMYPKVEEHLIVRMRWLKNNLKKHNRWDSFEDLAVTEKNIPLLSYIWACNPNSAAKDKTKHANLLVSELLENKKVWSSTHKMEYAQIMLWDVHAFVTDKKALKETANFYFFKSESTKKYKDIANFLGGTKKNNVETNTAIDLLNKALEGYSNDSLEKEKYHNKATEVLRAFTPEILFKVIDEIRNHDIAKRCFVYLWKNNLKDKKIPLVTLFTYLGNTLHEIKEELIDEKYSNIITNENDPHIDIVLAFYTVPEANFRDQNMFLAAKLTALNLFWGVAHYPKVFQFLINAIKQAPTEVNEKIMDTIYTSILSQDYDTKINSTLKFSKDQIETMLETICQWFLDYGYHAEGYRSIYYYTNPLAKEWIAQKLEDPKWLKQFAGIKTFYDPLDEELKDALTSALEFIADKELNTYLEFSDEDSNKFWKIDFYGEAFIITYGKIGVEGRTSEKNFDSIDLCHKAGQKLIDQKLKKGYVENKN